MILTENEKRLFQQLLEVADEIGVEIYAVGGWVRDRLLGFPSKDIDIMVVGISGEVFAKKVSKNLKLDDPSLFRINPSKSKLVETARLKMLFGDEFLDIDFAMARSETYNQDSRIPDTVKPATAAEDAGRRDACANALFYNLRTETVEDFTGRGLDDLKNRILRAPGDPFVRLMEDPLRVVRFLRYSARFQFKIEGLTWNAMADRRVMDRLFKLTARERIGEEFLKSMTGPHPEDFLRMGSNLDLWDRLIGDAVAGTEYEGQLAPWTMDQNNRHHQLNLWQHTLAVVARSGDDLAVRLAAFLHDTGKRFKPVWGTNTVGDTNYLGHEDHSVKIARLFLNHLQVPSDVVDQACAIIENHMRPFALLDSSKKAMRRLLRDLASKKLPLEKLLQHVAADIAGKSDENDTERQPGYFQRFSQQLIDLAAEPLVVPRNKCILDGHEIKAALERPKDGPWIGVAQTWLLDQMDEQPMTKDEARIALLEAVGTGKLVL